MSDNPFVRVKDNRTGHEYSVRESALDADHHDVLDGRPAVDASGDPLPHKPSVPKGEAKDHRDAKRPAAPSQSTPATAPTTNEEK